MSTQREEKSNDQHHTQNDTFTFAANHPDEVFALNPKPSRATTFENTAIKLVEIEKKSKRRWYPWLLLSIALNTFLLAAVFYIIYEADYYNKSRSGYLWRACAIIFIPLVPTAFLLFWPFADWWTARRDAFSERRSSPQWRHVVNLLNAVACFVFTLSFLFFSAIPKYNSPIWQTSVDIPDALPMPAMALGVVTPDTVEFGTAINNQTKAADAQLFSGYTSNDVQSFPDSALYTEYLPNALGSDVGMTMIVANSSEVQDKIPDPFLSALTHITRLAYNSTAQSRSVLTSDMPPQMYALAFDPRLSVREIILCATVPAYTINAFAQTTFAMSVSQISDPRLKMVRPRNRDPICGNVYDMLSYADPPISMFDLTLSSSVQVLNNFTEECNVDGDVGPLCLGGVLYTYGSQTITTQISVPGKSKQDIWIDCGAIVGAIQFFAWFLLVFFQE